MERVAERAGLNKSLVYRHFENRDRLYEAALESVFADRFALLEDLPRDLGSLFETWTERFSGDSTFLTMLLREAIESNCDEPVHDELRRRYYERQIELIRDLQAEGTLPSGVPADYVFLMLMAVLVFPYALPQIAYLVTGEQPGSEAFRRRWRTQFGVLVERLAMSDGRVRLPSSEATRE